MKLIDPAIKILVYEKDIKRKWEIAKAICHNVGCLYYLSLSEWICSGLIFFPINFPAREILHNTKLGTTDPHKF